MMKDTGWSPGGPHKNPPASDLSFEEELAKIEADLTRDMLPYVARLEALLPRLALVPGAQRAEKGAQLNLVAARVKGALGRP